NGHEFFIVKNVRTESSDVHSKRFSFKLTYLPGKAEELECLLKGNTFNKLPWTKTGKLRLFSAVVVGILPYLNVGTKLAKLCIHVLSGFRIDAELAALRSAERRAGSGRGAWRLPMDRPTGV